MYSIWQETVVHASHSACSLVWDSYTAVVHGPWRNVRVEPPQKNRHGPKGFVHVCKFRIRYIYSNQVVFVTLSYWGIPLCPWRDVIFMGSELSLKVSSMHGPPVVLGITNSSHFSGPCIDLRLVVCVWPKDNWILVSHPKIVQIDSWNSHQKTLLKHLTWHTSKFWNPFFPAHPADVQLFHYS